MNLLTFTSDDSAMFDNFSTMRKSEVQDDWNFYRFVKLE